MVLIGDTVHATTPHLAGGAMCLEDVVALGEELSAVPSIPKALGKFFERRVDRCRFVVEASVQIAEWQLTPGVPGADAAGLRARAFGVLAEPF